MAIEDTAMISARHLAEEQNLEGAADGCKEG
jgi:hypothetical protein